MNKLKTGILSLVTLASTSYVEAQVADVWGDIDYKGKPWVSNESKPNEIKHGLAGRHISLWASHGRFYDADKGRWRWQRPNLFCTTEDLFTQTIVVPYLIPMLQNAGAIVFTPRERDWQTNEVIIDNDDKLPVTNYFEFNDKYSWQDAGVRAFAHHPGDYADGENPFSSGSARKARAVKGKHESMISYQPNIPEGGRYAVYVSYKTVEGSVDDAQYIVYHKGQETHFRVNQQMGGGTWVYLGTFDFDKGCNEFNRVVLTNNSRNKKGIVTADAVRFGGGMGNIERGGVNSGLPRCLEGARYYGQWAGAPYSVYSSKGGRDDYGDDINVRSLMTNWLAGGSDYVPAKEGLRVPIELSLAVHSDAGYARDGKGLIGSLAVCTTNFNNGRLNAGITRMASKDFASDLLSGIMRDIPAEYKNWNRRYLWDRNYSETRLPEVPSAIIETMSHQNFPDMALGQDPNFKFSFARSLYKTIARFISRQHGKSCVISPLQPLGFKVELLKNGYAQLTWRGQEDKLEPTAKPKSYNVYISTGTSGFDNGISTKNTTFKVKLEPGVRYNFKVTACNAGGESFPTEVLSAYYQPMAHKTILVINGFTRLSAPAIIDNAQSQGFDMEEDPGVPYGLYAGWNGKQTGFDKSKMGIEGYGGLGYGGDEMAGKFIMGNTFDYAKTHADAIASAGKYNVESCSMEALLSEEVDLNRYHGVDLIFGLQKYNSYTPKYYSPFNSTLVRKIKDYTAKGGALLVSGAYIGSDNTSFENKQFLSSVLKAQCANADTLSTKGTINGLGMNFDIYEELNATHYAATKTDILAPVGNAICAMQYQNGASAAVGYKGNDYSVFTMGFPFECIKDEQTRESLMRGIWAYLLGN